VAGYTITITPSNDDAGAQTTIQVDTASGSARITELTVRAVDGGGLSPHQLAAVNLDALIAALSPTGTSAPAAITASAPTVQPGIVAEADAGVSELSPQPAAAAAPGTGRARKSARKSAAKKAPSRSRQAKAEKAAAAAPSSTGRRAYRRMPEPSEVLDAYRQVGGTTALARHFGVPRHTATGWLRRLRSMGQLDS
jgi:hypothetical protein